MKIIARTIFSYYITYSRRLCDHTSAYSFAARKNGQWEPNYGQANVEINI